MYTLATTGLPTVSQVWQPLANSRKQYTFSRCSSNYILITLTSMCHSVPNRPLQKFGNFANVF